MWSPNHMPVHSHRRKYAACWTVWITQSIRGCVFGPILIWMTFAFRTQYDSIHIHSWNIQTTYHTLCHMRHEYCVAYILYGVASATFSTISLSMQSLYHELRMRACYVRVRLGENLWQFQIWEAETAEQHREKQKQVENKWNQMKTEFLLMCSIITISGGSATCPDRHVDGEWLKLNDISYMMSDMCAMEMDEWHLHVSLLNFTSYFISSTVITFYEFKLYSIPYLL